MNVDRVIFRSYCVKIVNANASEVRIVGKFASESEAKEWIEANAVLPEYRGAMFVIKAMGA